MWGLMKLGCVGLSGGLIKCRLRGDIWLIFRDWLRIIDYTFRRYCLREIKRDVYISVELIYIEEEDANDCPVVMGRRISLAK